MKRALWTALLATMLVPLASPAAPAQADAEAARPKTIVTLTFDDGDASHAKVARILEKHHMRGTFYVNSGTLGTKGKLSRKQVVAIQKAGHEIGGHTLTHPYLTQLSFEQQRAEICDDRAALLKMGLRVRTFAYPYGALDAGAKQAARQCGYNAARTVGGLSNRRCKTCVVAEPMRPETLYSVRTPGSVLVDATPAQIEQLVVNAERSGGGVLPLVFHHMCDKCDTYSVSERTLTRFLDWLAKRKSHGTVVRRFGDVIGGKMRPVPTED
ncbi:polysaccharide deacetylase family protein [Microbispora sp. RL4-1S]|uniref:Polysaccharide deacetylase family protein n=1 Tax=Microbispora oryzae TaxID=2806554 RepID=A0A940WPJ9_9ACTN|nr:polysaccharide deacetylase family protein [Microbispora oryzae]MBP2705180.1 polysaccharide deacetylase family protein [Microbispora oryzae]